MLVAVLVILLLALLYKVTQRPSGFPPGVWGWPIVGYVPPRDVPLAQHLNTLRKKFGDIFTMKMGKHMAVILSDFQLIKTAFNKPELQGRPDFFTLKIFTNFKNAGIISSVGDVWQQNRRFALQHLKYFGMGKSKLESSVQREALNLLNDLEASVGIPTELTWNINMAILNVTWQLAAARSYSVDDKEILEFFKMVSVNFDIIQGPAALLDLYPWLIHIMPTFLKNSWMRVNQLDESRERIHSLLKDIIDDHCKTLDTDNPRDYIDVYLTEHLKDDTHLPALGHQDILTNTEYINLLANLSDLFVAGSETTSSTLRWACLYLALHPEVQTKIQKEIDSVVPRDTLPSLEHKEELVYLEATLREVQRKGTIVPLGVVHSATANTTLAGYSFPEVHIFGPG
ncbi:cytochrome P450 2L1-like [Homarus americanus]|uniref:cytochrome P450 2L1-like n=1 Tax=Homarus americanus TaxID=6706 RepID=UPI001C470E2F|nr:cytochrome P450 2L1-like [Homarus americanus]XP_042208887.1 cytochrome P450 2L1-like [Homarus americanus]